MKRTTSKFLAIILTVAMCLSLLPATVSAAADSGAGGAVTSIKLASRTEKLQLSHTVALKTEIKPESATTSLEWSSSNENVATVSGDGVVTGKNVGKATITVGAGDGAVTDSCTVTVVDEPYSVQVYVPKGVTGEKGLSFYPSAGFGTDNRDTYEGGKAITSVKKDTKTDKNYDIYSMTLAGGVYSYRAVDSKGNSLGGGAFKLPAEASGGTYQPNDDTKIYLRVIESYITNEVGGKKASAQDYTVTLMNKIGVLTLGDPYVNGDGYECYPVLAFVSGNALLYYTLFTPAKEYASSNDLGLAIWKNDAIQPEVDPAPLAAALKETSTFTINTPKGAEAALFTQVLNFNAERIDSVKTVDLADGTVDHVFNVLRTSDLTYRVSLEGMRTKAGFVNNVSGDRLEVRFDPADSPKEQDYSGQAFDESSLLLNINERNKLQLDVGEQYKVRAYRAAWQIIQTITDNIMVEPDFHYQVLSGSDVISVETMDGGNADGNWAWITGKKPGVAVVEVSYDALDVNDAQKVMWVTKSDGFYGATDSVRTGVFVVAVGDGYGDVPGISWDTEYNTCYFLGESGVLDLTPEGKTVAVSVASVLDGKMSEWKPVAGANGSFAVPVMPGNNVVRIEADGVTDYRVVRGAQLSVIINNNVEGRDEIYPGDTVSVSLKGLYMPIPKFAGIYNPGFPNTTRVSFELNGETYSSGGAQYHIIQPAANVVKVEIPESASGSVTLTGGKLGLISMGSPYGAHRTLTDVGVPANFNAASLRMKDTPLPEITIQIAQPPEGWTPDRSAGQEAAQAGGTSGTDKTHLTSYYPTEKLNFDLSSEEIAGYVTISFEDYGVRLDDADLETPLGVIISPTQVPFQTGDNIADVTLRLLDALEIGHTNTGSADNSFYLASIEHFKLSDGTEVDSFGEFDSGAGSGWMITQNNWYINSSTSNFQVEDGDFIRWQNTCQIGADIGCDWENGSAEITGLRFYQNFGTLSPSFQNDETTYTYTVPSSVKELRLEGIQENYWAILTYTSGGKTYKPREPIPVEDGTVIQLDCAFSEYAGDPPTDTDSVKIVIKVSDGTSEAGDGLTRGEFASLMERAVTGVDSYRADGAMDWAVSAGVTDGANPDQSIDRQQLVTMLYRYAQQAGKNAGDRVDLSMYTDSGDLAPWAETAMSWAVAEGIVGRVAGRMLAPNAAVSRQDAEAILSRFMAL